MLLLSTDCTLLSSFSGSAGGGKLVRLKWESRSTELSQLNQLTSLFLWLWFDGVGAGSDSGGGELGHGVKGASVGCAQRTGQGLKSKDILEGGAKAVWLSVLTTGMGFCGRFLSAGNKTFFSRAMDMMIPAVCK